VTIKAAAWMGAIEPCSKECQSRPYYSNPDGTEWENASSD